MQVWFQQDIVPLQIDFMEEAIIKEGQGKMFWVWNVRALEYLNHYLSQVMSVGNRLGKKLRKKLKGDPRKWTFGGVMVGSSWIPLQIKQTLQSRARCTGSVWVGCKMLQTSAGIRMAAACILIC